MAAARVGLRGCMCHSLLGTGVHAPAGCAFNVQRMPVWHARAGKQNRRRCFVAGALRSEHTRQWPPASCVILQQLVLASVVTRDLGRR